MQGPRGESGGGGIHNRHDREPFLDAESNGRRQGGIGAEEGGGGSGGGRGGLTLLLDNCSLKGFSTGKLFWPILLVGCGWLLLIPGGLRMVAVDSWWPQDGCC